MALQKKQNSGSRNLNATVAKLHAIYGKRLKAEDYSALMSCTSVADAAGYLKHSTYYSRILEGVDTDSIHRGNLEDVLRRGFYENYFRIIGFEKLNSDEFYNYITIKTEIDEILICITHINAGTDDHINTLPIFMNRYTSFDLMELAHVRTFSELMTLTEKTPYHDILKKYRPKPSADGTDGMIDYAGCELAFRTYYTQHLLDAASKYSGETGKKLRSFIGTQTDMINIINAYRMTRYFHADGKDIKARMIPVYVKIPEKKLDELYKANDEKEFMNEFSKNYYGRTLAEEGFDIKDPEMALFRLRYVQTKRAFSSSTAAPVCFYTFNTLAEIELKNIIRIIEGIRYSLPVKEISELIIS